MSKTKICSVCQKESDSDFCGTCGQKLGRKKTTVFSLIKDLFMNALDLEKSVFAALFILIRRPILLVENYFQGNRKYYPSPAKMLFYALAIAAIQLAYITPHLLGMVMDNSLFDQQILFWIIFFPLLTLTSYITFIGKKQKSAKHLISIVYLGSASFILVTVINSFIILIFGDILSIIAFVIFIAILFISNSRVFCPEKKYFQIILFTLLQFIVFAAVIAVLVLLAVLIVPDSVSVGQ
jgi:hypothetical protein